MIHNDENDKYIQIDLLQNNMKQLDRVRSFFAIIGGTLTGLLFLTGLNGLIAYLSLSLLINLALYAKMNFDVKKYLNITFATFILSDLSKSITSFILFWTLSYALVYIY